MDSLQPRRQRLLIAQTWDGQPLSVDECVHLLLQALPEGLQIDIDAPFADDPRPEDPPGFTDRLWEHEVVELFLLARSEGTPRYLELEFSPHGHWLGLWLEGVRRPTPHRPVVRYQAQIDGARWTGRAVVPWAELPTPAPDAQLLLNACAIRGTGDARVYHCQTALPGPRPDFHRLSEFREPLWLAAPG